MPDPEILQVNAWLGPDLLVLSTSRGQVDRLVQSQTLSLDGPLVQLRDEPLAAAVWYDNRQLVEFVRAWMTYGFQLAGSDGGIDWSDSEASNQDLEFSLQDLQQLGDRSLDLLGCFRSISSATRVENGVLITRFLMRFEDIPAE